MRGASPGFDATRARLSVAIPVYNGGLHLRALLESICAQTHPVDEIVISDDGSSDDGLTTSADYLRASGVPFQILRNPGPAGVSGNYENAISQCQGDLIFLADQDDIWPADRCEQYVRGFEDAAISLVAADSLLVDQNLHPLGERLWLRDGLGWSLFRRGSTRRDVTRILRARVVAHQIAIRSRCVPTLLQRPDGFYIEDWATWAAELSGCCLLLDQPLTLYRQHDSQTSRQSAAAAAEQRSAPMTSLLASLKRQQQRMDGTRRIWQEGLEGLDRRRAAELQRKLRRLEVYCASLQARIQLFEALEQRPSGVRRLGLIGRAVWRNLALGPLGLGLSCRDGIRLIRWSGGAQA